MGISANSMARLAPVFIKTTAIMKGFKTCFKNTSLTHEQKSIKFLVKAIEQLTHIKQVQYQASEQNKPLCTKVKSINNHQILETLNRSLFKKKDWASPIKNSALSFIEANKTKLHSFYEPKSLEWAWYLNQYGETKKSKIIIQELYDAEVKQLNKLTEAKESIHSSPLTKFSLLHNALYSLSTKEEKSKLDKTKREMQLKISKIPQMHILT